MTSAHSLEFRRQKSDELFEELKLSNLNDWYEYSTSDIRKLKGGWTIVKKQAFYQVMMKLYPEHKWYPWLFKGAFGFWKDKSNHKLFFEWISERLEISSIEDWYNIRKSDFTRQKGWGSLSKYYKSSHFQFIFQNTPSIQWKPWLFTNAPSGYWNSIENRRFAVKCFSEEKKILVIDDWYSITGSDLVNHQLGGLYDYYNHNLLKMLNEIYSEVNWKFWKFSKVGNGKWKKDENKKEYLNWFEKKMKIKSPDDWYHVKSEDFTKFYGSSLLASQFNGSPKQVAEYLYPDYEWLHWEFQTVGNGYWDKPENCKYYLDWLGEKIGITEVTDWYSATRDDLDKTHRASRLYQIYGGFQNAIVELIPNEQGWKRWFFQQVSPGFWKDKTNVIEYMNWLSYELKINSLDDWYSYDREVLIQRHGSGLLSNYSSSLQNILLDIYPNYEWDLSELYKIGKNQKQLYKIIKQIFPNEEISQNYRKHPDLKFSSGMPMELDIWIPTLSLAFEYQGEQHFESFHRGVTVLSSSSQSLESTQKRDGEKRQACNLNGIVLVEIDFKWEKTEEFVIEKIIESGFKFD